MSTLSHARAPDARLPSVLALGGAVLLSGGLCLASLGPGYFAAVGWAFLLCVCWLAWTDERTQARTGLTVFVGLWAILWSLPFAALTEGDIFAAAGVVVLLAAMCGLLHFFAFELRLPVAYLVGLTLAIVLARMFEGVIAGPANLRAVLPLRGLMVMPAFCFSLVLLTEAFRRGRLGRLAGGVVREDWPLLGALMIVAVYVFLPGGPLQPKLNYATQISALPLLYLLAKWAPENRHTVRRFERFALGFLIFLVVFGFVEYFILDRRFWVDVFNSNVLARVRGSTGADFLRGRSTGALHTHLFIGGRPVWFRRMASFVGNAISLGYFLAAFLLLAFVCLRNTPAKLVLLIVGSAGLIMTLSKGAWFYAASAAYFYLMFRGGRRRWLLMVPAYVILSVAMIGPIRSLRTTVGTHLLGLALPLSNLPSQPLGAGLGTGGNLGLDKSVKSVMAARATGAESGVGTVAYQMGLPGILVLLVALLTVLHALASLKARAPDADRKRRLAAAMALVLALFVCMLLQENALNVTISFLPMSYAGLLAGTERRTGAVW